jgi:hypothetical protein
VQPLHLGAQVAQIDSRLSAVTAVGLKTSMPASLMNDVVMMKKMSKLIVKSSIGARSMP